MSNQQKIERFRSLNEEDRLLVLTQIRDTMHFALEPDVFGILQLALDRGTEALSEKQLWRLLLGAWVHLVVVECSRCSCELPPEEMVHTTQGRCDCCENAWQKILAE